MQEKLQSKYGSSFSERQSKIVQLYCEGRTDELKQSMEQIQKEVSALTKKYQKMHNDKFLLERVMLTENVVSNTEFSNTADSVSKIMLLDQLANELKGITNV